MAADLYLMDQSVAGLQQVTLRFYSWQPAAITIGYMQQAGKQLDLTMLEHDNVAWIRRPTGGRAVLHNEDLTYSCIFPRSLHAMGASVGTTYEMITRCLARGLKEAGIGITVQDSASPLIKSGRDVKLPCFLAPNRNEIMVQGKKFVGSAQYRSAAAVLQHGSLPLSPVYRQLPRYLLIPEEERRRQITLLEEKSVSLHEIDASITGLSLVTALKEGFAATLDCPYFERNWSDEELAAIQRLMQSPGFIGRWLADAPGGE